jgi:hypothetical protein
MLVLIVVCGGATLIYLWWKMRRVKVDDEYRGYRVKSARGGGWFIEKNGDFISSAPSFDSAKSEIDALLGSDTSR